MSKRKCDGCTACCEGYLSANIHGHQMHRGRPCHFVDMNRGCTIYKDRPKEICVAFKCVWLKDDNKFLPEWIKPNLSGIIIQELRWGENHQNIFFNVVEYREKIKPEVLNWLINFSDQHMIPIRYHIDQQQFTRGPPEFHKFVTESFNDKVKI